tara:strand:+ start:448 stop:1119 length:672 start_codon:yes stop_codon:yes gene_type:complete
MEVEPSNDKIKEPSRDKRLLNWLKSRFVTGVFVFFPLAVTYFILSFVFNLIDGIFRPFFETLFDRSLPGLSFILILLIVLLLGAFANWGWARRRFSWVESLLKRIPVIGATYSTSKEIAGAFRGARGSVFGTVVSIQYPRDGAWTIGFLTKIVDFEEGVKHGIVYMPSTPVPNTGWMVMIPTAEIRYLDITADKAMKFIIGGGIGSPGYIDWVGREKTINEPD